MNIEGYKDYLKNDLCQFTLLNKKDIYKKKRNMFTTSFFKLKKGYKDFSNYMIGLQNWINFLNSFENDYIFRIFIDENIYNDKKIMNILQSDNKIELVLYNCEKYKEGKYHIELFGTLIRYYPLFDFSNNDSNHVIVTDIDMDLKRASKGTDPRIFYKFLMTKKPKEYFIGYGEPQKYILSNFIDRLYIYAECMSMYDKYNNNYLTNFLNNIETIVPKWNIAEHNKRFTTFGFGIDEIFINDYLLKRFNDYSGMFEYYISYFMYFYEDKIKKNNKSNTILKYILGKYYKKGMNIDNMRKFIDSNTYSVREYNEINNYLTVRFNNMIKYLYKNNIEWMDLHIMKMIYENFNDVIYGIIVVTTNSNTDLINFKVYNKIKTKNISNDKISLKF